jgi:arsenite/tail-anchored protein-transporting ATPase
VLAVSTDPAHSLGDAFNLRLSARLTRIPAARGAALEAVELDAPRALARWIGEHHDALGDIVANGTWLDRHDIDALLALPLPGVDELVGMLEIVSLAGRRPKKRRSSTSRAYDFVIIDTAPTGHTLRLLAAPDAVRAIAAVLDALQEEHRIIRREFGRIGRPEAADRLIELLVGEAADTRALLRDRRRTAFEWVMLPEELSLAESRDGIAALRRARIPIVGVIVNRVLPIGPHCALCDRRRVEARKVLAKIRRLARTVSIRLVPEQLHEPRGVDALSVVGRSLIDAAALPRHRSKPLDAGPGSVARAANRDRGRPHPRVRPASPETVDAFLGARLLFFGGKGGVGKTTTAAAAALRLARNDPSRRVLLLSTDPAHSLADVFGGALGDRARRVGGGPKNLFVRELDAAAALAKRRTAIEAALSEASATFGAEASPASQLVDFAPPGIDELFALLAVTELTEVAGRSTSAAERTKYDLILVDTPPTGHALRLMEMPGIAREWVQLLMRVLLKYRSLAKPGRFAQEIVDLSQSIRRLQTLLHDPRAARFIVVTRAADVPQLETGRLLNRLGQLQLATPAIIVNALTLAPGSCPRCRAVAAAEQRVVAAFARHCSQGQCAIIQTPLVAPPPRGSRVLERWAGRWIA